jgi:very-short-patch-repair endonuclease
MPGPDIYAGEAPKPEPYRKGLSELQSQHRKVTATPAQMSLMAELNRQGLYPDYEFPIQTDILNEKHHDHIGLRPDLFFSHKLCIFVDGPIHNHGKNPARDAKYQAWLEGHGYTVIRFTNERVKKDIQGVVSEIREALTP